MTVPQMPLIGEFLVLDGTATRCRGCGAFRGITCVAFPDDWEPPPEPDWEFAEGNCWWCVAWAQQMNTPRELANPETLPVGMRGSLHDRLVALRAAT